jgi:hypothetical protein
LALAQWPHRVQSVDQPRNLAIIVEVLPHKAVFGTDEALLCDVLIRNELKREIRVAAYLHEPNSWNGETAFVRVVDIYRQPDPVIRPGEWRPKVSKPRGISGAGSHPVKPGDAYRLTIDLRKWPLAGAWSAGDYRFNMCAEWIAVDSYTTAHILGDFAAISIR